MEVAVMVFMGFSNGIWFGMDRAMAQANLPTSTPPPRWGYRVLWAVIAVLAIWFVVFAPPGDQAKSALFLTKLGLGFVASYGVGVVLAFQITRRLVKNHRPA